MDLSQFSQEDLMKLRMSLTPKLNKYMPYTPTPKQAAFLLCNDREVLFGGAAGGGKSIAQLMAALQYVDIPGYSSILFRKTFADLSLPGALIDVSKQWLMPFVDSKEVHWAEKDKCYTFPSGAKITFGYLESENDCYRYQGAEFQYIGFDECTHISPYNYRYLFSRLRKPKTLHVPLRFRATCNPGGQFGEYYYERFFVEGPDKGRIFIGSTLKDNPYIDAEEYLLALDELDPVTKAQLLDGNWDIREPGDMFYRKWFQEIMPSEEPAGLDFVRFWDIAASDVKKNKRADTTVGTLLGYNKRTGVGYIKGIDTIQATPGSVEKFIQLIASKDGRKVKIRMEQEPGSSGLMVTDYYKRNVLRGYDFEGINSSGNKTERAKPVSQAAENGLILINKNIPCLGKFYDQIELFPKAAHDDFVDSLSGGYNTFKKVKSNTNIKILSKGTSYWKRYS